MKHVSRHANVLDCTRRIVVPEALIYWRAADVAATVGARHLPISITASGGRVVSEVLHAEDEIDF
jgi:hypothetical protein